ncbi:WYL domain-containing protein [Brevibacillus panacihumi]|uniref:WYL domain-containing protein n=1 Tax=Brevibacillus panacihumi TaxID=497735 RepID=A0A3M8CTK5_9BACL|nr:WYL domain-containing protein [Brevibacillus panacihumi]RNB79044.1 WYL domain-containing protein [Brevibacillus panacihumi]
MEKELQRAISQQKNVQIIYVGSNDQATQRTIRPIKVAGNRLKAYCLTRKAPRVFAIGNILAIHPVVNGRAV